MVQSTGSLKYWDLITGSQNASSSPAPYHYISKGLFTAVPFAQYTPCSAIKKKLGILKGKQFGETEQALEADSDTSGMLELPDLDLKQL